MSDYVLSVIGTVLLCTILTGIAPTGKTSAVIKGIARLACVLTIIAPVLRFFNTGELKDVFDEKGQDIFLENGIEGTDSFIQYHSEARIRETEDALEVELLEKYNLATEVSISWEWVREEFGGRYYTDEIRITKIQVVAPNGTEEVKKKMWVYLTESYCSEVLIE